MELNQKHLGVVRPFPRLARSVRLGSTRPGLKAGLLGLICVVGLFAALGLLYAAG